MPARPRSPTPATATATPNVVKFPPLPPVPRPPRGGADARQQRAERTLANFAQLTSSGGGARRAPGRSGYPASGLDVGALKAALEQGLRRFSMRDVRQRWKEEVMPWLWSVTKLWVQRCGRFTALRRKTGIHLRIRTSDDYGYYEYRFDVFPGR